jgi:hypothetical protein
MTKKELKKKDTPTEIVLGGIVDVGEEDETYKKLKGLKMDDEKITVKNKITGKTTEMQLVRQGTQDRDVAMTLLDANQSRDRKDSIIAQYLFERGKESSSFLAELFISKGTHTKETHAFKKQMRFDFEQFADMFTAFLRDTSTALKKDANSVLSPDEIFFNLAERFNICANEIVDRIQAITQQRIAEKGFGIFVDKNGKAYSIFDEGVDDVIKKEREEAKKEKDENR